MGTITVRNLDEDLKRRLRIRAAQNGHSMEQEVRDILKAALYQEPMTGKEWVQAIRARSTTSNWKSRPANPCANHPPSTE